MNRFFEHSGWLRVEGQVGRTGFDGLYIKQENGIIKDALIVESKYGSSKLQSTNFGVQMSEDWIQRKLVELKARFPNEDIYQKISSFIEAGAYRSVLWNLKLEKDVIQISLSKVKSKGGTVDIAEASDKDVTSLIPTFTSDINLKSPRNKFEEDVIAWYQDELIAIGKH
jgi:hypothetical protein